MMDETQCSPNALPPFITKTYEMVDDSSTDSIVSWSQSNNSFIVWNPPEFSRELLPKFFKHNNFASFIRQLNTYGFRKIDPELWEFANEDFIRDQPHLLKNIHRRKPIHSHSIQNNQGQGTTSSALTESEKQSYRGNIERLKCDMESLISESQRHKEEQERIDMQMQVFLTGRLQHVEQRQKNMLSSLAQTLQKPELALNLIPQSEIHERRRRLPRGSYFHDEASIEGNQMGTSQIVARENLNAASALLLNKESFEQLESSLIFWESIIHDANQAYMQQNSSLELDESTSCADSPTISYTQLNVDVGSKTAIDMNSMPAAAVVSEVAVSEEQVVGTGATTPTGVNDVFWEQFLTENPGSTDATEVQSERKDFDGRKNESKSIDHGKFWWSMRSVNNLAEQLGQLTSAERT